MTRLLLIVAAVVTASLFLLVDRLVIAACVHNGHSVDYCHAAVEDITQPLPEDAAR